MFAQIKMKEEVEVIGVEVGVKVVGTDGGNVVRESNLEDEVVGDPVS